MGADIDLRREGLQADMASITFPDPNGFRYLSSAFDEAQRPTLKEGSFVFGHDAFQNRGRKWLAFPARQTL